MLFLYNTTIILVSHILYNPNLDIHVQLNYATINKSKSPIHISTHIDKIQTK